MLRIKYIFYLVLISYQYLVFSQKYDSEIYDFINSIYSNHVDSSLNLYYLYQKPIDITNEEIGLIDTINIYFEKEESEYLLAEISHFDSIFQWDSLKLINAIVINETRLSSLNIKQCPLYYFSKPIFSLSKNYAIFKIKVDMRNQGYMEIFIYRKLNNKWQILSKLIGTGWMRFEF
ncbi:MAG: hypothetical protein AMS27_08690 [Bacteroides sp. SM23_62_1]|nr:MAG: hypothetical protein AMS27_08690 [Bacteroides sp. SM23_62_1]